MYYFLSLLSGILIAIMILVNGGLAEVYSLHWATVFIHIIGLILIILILLVKREDPFTNRQRWFFYLGGAIGVLNVVSANVAFGRISVSAILALGLLGQSVAGLIIDHFGIWGLPKHRMSRGNLVGLVIILIGVVPMLTSFEIVAVLMSFAGGVGVVLNRTFNAKLAEVTTIGTSTFYNYIVGLLVALPIFWFFGREDARFCFAFASSWYLYTGGLLGVVLILMSNVLVLKIAAFYLTLLIFIGQVFTGILIDAVLDGAFSPQIFLGGILVAAGLGANLLMDRKRRST
ncbi:MAG: DMT family transporter [Oscillospiraceae bacterium]|nr:DMT family transporter [Oscillospiraceae bacterium]